jgi:hypothetical protein
MSSTIPMADVVEALGPADARVLAVETATPQRTTDWFLTPAGVGFCAASVLMGSITSFFVV